MLRIFGTRKTNDGLLDDAVRALRDSARNDAATLSSSARGAILERSVRAFDPADATPFRTTPLWKPATAAAALVVLTAAMIVVSPFRGPSSRPVELIASKQGDQIVFEIRDGRGPHQVRKSTDAANFRARPVTVEDGRFHDRAESGPVLVFYKVD